MPVFLESFGGGHIIMSEKKGGWWITCPRCQHEAHMDDFDPSLSDECTCPGCGLFFEVDLSARDDEDDEDTES